MTDQHADTITAWAVIKEIAESDAGGWLMEFTAVHLIRERDALLAERQQDVEIIDNLHAKLIELRAERQQAQEEAAKFRQLWRAAEGENRTLHSERQQAMDALRDSIELADEAMGYVAEWATKKWQMRERLATLCAALAKLGEQP